MSNAHSAQYYAEYIGTHMSTSLHLARITHVQCTHVLVQCVNIQTSIYVNTHVICINSLALKIIVTITLGIIGGHCVGVSKCCACTLTHATVPLWIVWETQKNDYTCAVCLTCTVYSYIETILLLLRAIYTVFKQCTYVFQACNFTFKYTVCRYAHSRGLTFTASMGLCHNNVCSKHHY